MNLRNHHFQLHNDQSFRVSNLSDRRAHSFCLSLFSAGELNGTMSRSSRLGLECVQICWTCVDRDVSLSAWNREEIFLLLIILENGGFSLGEIQNNFISSFGEFSFGLSSRMYCTLILSGLYLSLVMDRYISKNRSYYLLWCERVLIILSVFLLAVAVIHFTLIIPR